MLLLEACRIPCTAGSNTHCKTMQTAADYLVGAFVHGEDMISWIEQKAKNSHNDKMVAYFAFTYNALGRLWSCTPAL